MNLILLFVVFVISLFTLIKASDFFTNAAEKMGLFFGLSPFIIGVTIVSIGTSLPELISSILAALKDSSEIVIGNVVGSNIANIFLILGTAAVISKKFLLIQYDLVDVDLPLFVGSAFLLSFTVKDGNLSSGEALILLSGFLLYLLYVIYSTKEENENNEESVTIQKSDVNIYAQIVIIIISSVFIFLGANYTIEFLRSIAELLNIGTEIMAVSAVAIGTSLPELMVTISATIKGNPEIAIGNVLGSNIFNSFVVMGIPGLIKSLVIPETVIKQGIPIMLAGTILFFFTTQDKKVTRWEGWLFFLIYIWFIGKTFNFL